MEWGWFKLFSIQWETYPIQNSAFCNDGRYVRYIRHLIFINMGSGYFLGLPKSPGLPPSISKRIYDRICPHDDRLYLDDSKVKEYIGLPKDSDDLYWRSSGKELLDAWLSLLNSPDVRDKRCVQITGPQIFTIW